MPLHALKVPSGRNQFFAAFSLSLLVPVLYDEVLLDEVLEKLFGRMRAMAMANLVNDLRAYKPSHVPKSLRKVIKTYLRPKLADYILANKADYLALFDSEASLMAAVDKVRSGAEFLGALEEIALARMTGINLYLYRSKSDSIPFKTYEHVGGDAQQGVRLVGPDKSLTGYQCLIAPERLSYKLRRHFFPETIRDIRAIMWDIYLLCSESCQRHIYVTRDRDKLTIIRALQYACTQEEVLKQLDSPCGIKGYESWSNKAFLLRPSMNWALRWLIAAVVIVTFPLSIPLWLFYSWAQDRWDFIATKDRIFVKKLTALCQEEVAPEVVEGERALAAERALSPPPPRPALKNTSATRGPSADDSSDDSSRETATDSRVTNPFLSGEGGGYVGREDNFDDINHHLAIGMERLLLMMVDGMYRKETGRPMVTIYRINRENPPEPGMFSIDIKVQFRWTSQPPMRAQLKLLKAFSPPPVDHLAPFVSPEAPPPTRMEAMQRSMPFFFKPKPDFDALLKQIDIDAGVKKQWTADAALKLPHTVSQRMALVVKMIDYYEYRRKSDTYAYALHPAGRDGFAAIEIKAKGAIDSWLAKLPPNYQALSPEADAIAAAYQSIIEHLQAGKVDEAWELFQPVSDVSPFICYAFPNLKAMERQLAAVFIITWHKQWNEWLRISESETIRETLNFLNLACKIVAPYNPAQKELIERLARTPLLQLIEAGKVAESRTSQEERVRISEERSNRVEGPMRGWGDLSFRDPFDNIDAGDTLPPPPPPPPPPPSGSAIADAPRSPSPR